MRHNTSEITQFSPRDIWTSALGMLDSHGTDALEMATCQAEAMIDRGDVAAYRRDCVKPALDGAQVPPSCRTLAAIGEAYGVDPFLLLQDEKNLLVMTARYIARGEVLTEKDYEACIRQGRCARIPLAAQMKNPNGPEGQKARALFAHLLNEATLTPVLCDLLETCRALLATGLVEPAQLDTL